MGDLIGDLMGDLIGDLMGDLIGAVIQQLDLRPKGRPPIRSTISF